MEGQTITLLLIELPSLPKRNPTSQLCQRSISPVPSQTSRTFFGAWGINKADLFSFETSKLSTWEDIIIGMKSRWQDVIEKLDERAVCRNL